MTLSDHDPTTTGTDERALISELARLALERAAPEELILFDETAGEYFRDPVAVLQPKRRDEAVGFGLDFALLSPYILLAATAVVRFVVETSGEVVRDEAKSGITAVIQRLVRRTDDASAAPPALSAEQLTRVREVAYDRVRGAGVADQQASLIADAVVGGLATA